MTAARRWAWNGSSSPLGGVRGALFGVPLVGSTSVGLDRIRLQCLLITHYAWITVPGRRDVMTELVKMLL